MMTLDRVTQVLADLVRIASVNPALVPGGAGEERIARYVANFLQSAGFETHLQEISPGRFNAIGVLRGSGGGRSLMLNGHLDTVGVAGMEEPYSARIESGQLYGRGAQDMKGGVAAALVAAESLASGPPLPGDVIVAGVADEEFQSAGTRALLAGSAKSDAAIVMEPTGLQVVTTHKGFAWAEVETFGRAAHGSRPQEGLDAIALMGRVLVEIERLGKALSGGPTHPLLGHGSVHASLIAGGQELSSYPAHCRLSLERRLVPGEDIATLEAELAGILEKLRSLDPDFRGRFTLGYWARPLETPPDIDLVQTVAWSARRVLGRKTDLGTQSFWTDAALLSEAGIPSVLFGPSGSGLHSTQESVNLDTVLACARVLADCAKSFCGNSTSL